MSWVLCSSQLLRHAEENFVDTHFGPANWASITTWLASNDKKRHVKANTQQDGGSEQRESRRRKYIITTAEGVKGETEGTNYKIKRLGYGGVRLGNK